MKSDAKANALERPINDQHAAKQIANSWVDGYNAPMYYWHITNAKHFVVRHHKQTKTHNTFDSWFHLTFILPLGLFSSDAVSYIIYFWCKWIAKVCVDVSYCVICTSFDVWNISCHPFVVSRSCYTILFERRCQPKNCVVCKNASMSRNCLVLREIMLNKARWEKKWNN